MLSLKIYKGQCLDICQQAWKGYFLWQCITDCQTWEIKTDQWENLEDWEGRKYRRGEQSCAAERRQKMVEITYLTHIIADKQVEEKDPLLINIQQLSYWSKVKYIFEKFKR